MPSVSRFEQTFSVLRIGACLLIGVLAISVSARAADDEPAGDSAAPAAAQPSAEEIAELIRQLDSDKFAQRQAASDALGKLGKAVIEPLGEAATGDSLEVTVRSLEILTKMLESTDDAAKEAAKKALEKVAKSDRRTAARRAADALKAFEEKHKPAPQAIRGGIQMAIGGAGRRVSIRNVNGVKTIEASEGDQKVKIVDDPKNGIKMEVTEKKNGKASTKKYEAKNADELKKKHPKAHEIYKKYSNQGGNIMVQMRVGGGAVPAAIQRVRPNPVDTAARILPALSSHIKRLASDEAIKGASKESKENLKKKLSEIKQQLTELEKRLQDSIDKADKEPKDDEKKLEPEQAGKE